MTSSQSEHRVDRNGVRVDDIVDLIFGTPVHDPYRYLEDAADAQTVAWTAEQNRLTRATLDALPSRAPLLRRFDDLLRIGWTGAPVEAGARYFFTARRGDLDQAVLYVREGGVDRVLVAPAALDPSGLTALDWWYPSPQGTYVAFGLSRSGDERSTLYVLDVATAQRRSEAIPHTRASVVAWLPDESGFYYTCFPGGGNYEMRLCVHTLGADWNEDGLVFGEGRAPEDWLGVQLSRDGSWLIVTAQRGWTATDVYLRDLRDPHAPFVAVIEGVDAITEVRCRGDELFIRSNDGAPRFALFTAAAASPQREHWRELVAQQDDVLDAFAVSADRIVASYLHDAHARLVCIDASGTMAEVALPDFGTVSALSAQESSSEAFVQFVSFTVPSTVYRVDTGTASAAVWSAIESPIDASPYEVEQVWYESRDRTRIPMYVLRRRETARDGRAPAVLTGYGGFNVAYLPAYFASIVPWLDAGGVYAVANLRGGGEFGAPWHRAGMRALKQHVFDDFIAAAEFLGAHGYADPARIGCIGGSNGGLLVAAATVQRPDLFRAVVCAVPLCDMVRFPYFLIARLWVSEYGDPESAADFPFIYAYSPYHHVEDGVAYPAMLFLTAESDSRVDPLHARKMGARVQAATGGDGPILVHIEQHAGHGAGKPRSKQAEELADRWSFFAWQLGVEIAF
ncbi:MAG TPA: prolyl oligopeptidase family serine peptidase [Candidatus Acidoferrales bacterium]|nr:prolyl oligopeptidase family serine peptidase [Candidatus Acidoferrales bacterium]